MNVLPFSRSSAFVYLRFIFQNIIRKIPPPFQYANLTSYKTLLIIFTSNWIFAIFTLYSLKFYLNELYTCKSRNGTIICFLWLVRDFPVKRMGECAHNIPKKKLLSKSLKLVRIFSVICTSNPLWTERMIDRHYAGNIQDSSELD